MKNFKLLFCVLLFIGITSCGASTGEKVVYTSVEQNPVIDKALMDSTINIDLINTVYDKFVFAIDADSNVTPETYFTANALKKLQEDYDFDCDEEPCYAYYALRTGMQYSKPGTDGSSQIYSIEPEDDWYVVFYSDMGWSGKTRIKIVDGKIDDYQRLK